MGTIIRQPDRKQWQFMQKIADSKTAARILELIKILKLILWSDISLNLLYSNDIFYVPAGCAEAYRNSTITSFSIAPEFGYRLNNKLDIGIYIEFAYKF